MITLIRIIWFLAVLLNCGSNVSVILRDTNYFQTHLSWGGHFYVATVGVLSFILIVTSLGGLLGKKVNRESLVTNIVAVLLIMALLALTYYSMRLFLYAPFSV